MRQASLFLPLGRSLNKQHVTVLPSLPSLRGPSCSIRMPGSPRSSTPLLHESALFPSGYSVLGIFSGLLSLQSSGPPSPPSLPAVTKRLLQSRRTRPVRLVLNIRQFKQFASVFPMFGQNSGDSKHSCARCPTSMICAHMHSQAEPEQSPTLDSAATVYQHCSRWMAIIMIVHYARSGASSL